MELSTREKILIRASVEIVIDAEKKAQREAERRNMRS
jgi:hypothetical protein